jgi:hypothetical protein
VPVEQLICTDCPRGKGVDPARAGYQVKACSPGLDAETVKCLERICLHYGDTVYRAAPREAHDRELAWRKVRAGDEPMPEEVRDAFPVLWSYDRLADDRYALTRVCYPGLTHDGRPGNFFAHALVFPPDALAACGSNPLALRRGRLFRASDPGDDTALPALAGLDAPAAAEAPAAVLRTPPYREHLPALVSALCTAAPSSRPLVLALPDWRHAEAVVEALLDLLPPSARRRTTVCTGEGDRTWLPAAGPGRPAGLVAAHHVLVLAAPDSRGPALRPDECQSTYAVFNFAGNQFSDLGAPRAFASFAAACVLDGRPDRLRGHHAVADQLGAGQAPAAWDALVPAAALAGPPAPADELVDGAHAVAGVAERPDQARAALGLLEPHLQPLAQAGDADALVRLAGPVARLADRLPAEERRPAAPGFLAFARGLARDALVRGRPRTADALLQACGSARPPLLQALLAECVAEGGAAPAVPAAADEAAALVDLLAGALEQAGGAGDGRAPAAPVLVLAFQAAVRADRAADAWARLGARFVQPRLAGAWDAGAADLLRQLNACLPPDKCPDGSAWLNLRLLEATRPKGQELVDALVRVVRSGARGADARQHTDYALRLVGEQVAEAERPLALGRLAEAAHATPAWDRLFAEHDAALRERSGNQQRALRRQLADAEAAHVLAEHLLADLLPWPPEGGPAAVKRWLGDVAGRPGMPDRLCHAVAGRLAGPRRAEVLPLARHLLTAGAANGPGLAALCGAAVLALPLAPLPDKWRDALREPPAGLAPEAAARLRVLRLLAEVRQRGEAPDWSPASFPHDAEAWVRDVAQLPRDERAQVVGQCLAGFAGAGVTTPADAAGLVRLLAAVGEGGPRGVADAAEALLRDRDPVTRVLTVLAFARGALDGAAADQADWPAIVGELLPRLGRETRRLFEDHLDRRFRRATPDADRREGRLREALGLPPRPAPAAEAEGKGPAPGEGGLLATAKRALGWLTGRRDGDPD